MKTTLLFLSVFLSVNLFEQNVYKAQDAKIPEVLNKLKAIGNRPKCQEIFGLYL